jgi:hypothetical protein
MLVNAAPACEKSKVDGNRHHKEPEELSLGDGDDPKLPSEERLDNPLFRGRSRVLENEGRNASVRRDPDCALLMVLPVTAYRIKSKIRDVEGPVWGT